MANKEKNTNNKQKPTRSITSKTELKDVQKDFGVLEEKPIVGPKGVEGVYRKVKLASGTIKETR